MSSWFECKVNYQKIDEQGAEKSVTEPYLIDAVSFTDAEVRIHKEMEPYISGVFEVKNIKRANYAELLPSETGDRWFKCKMSFITMDEEKGKEKRSNAFYLVQANDVKEAYETLENLMEGSISDYEIPAIQQSHILDVFPYNADHFEETTE